MAEDFATMFKFLAEAEDKLLQLWDASNFYEFKLKLSILEILLAVERARQQVLGIGPP